MHILQKTAVLLASQYHWLGVGLGRTLTDTRTACVVGCFLLIARQTLTLIVVDIITDAVTGSYLATYTALSHALAVPLVHWTPTHKHTTLDAVN